jgi:hypothetical protein
VQTTIGEALEASETPAAPGLLPEFAPLSEITAAQPMTQRRVLSLATPIIGENLLQTLVGAVDTFMVARLGAAAVARVGTGFEIVFFIISTLSAINVGATVLVLQAIGPSDRQRAHQLAHQAIVWGLVLAIPYWSVSISLHRRLSGSLVPSRMLPRLRPPICRSQLPQAWRCFSRSSAVPCCVGRVTAGRRSRRHSWPTSSTVWSPTR